MSFDDDPVYLNGTICIDGMGAPFMVYVSTPGHHRKTGDLNVIGEACVEGSVKRQAIPDVDPENKKP